MEAGTGIHILFYILSNYGMGPEALHIITGVNAKGATMISSPTSARRLDGVVHTFLKIKCQRGSMEILKTSISRFTNVFRTLRIKREMERLQKVRPTFTRLHTTSDRINDQREVEEGTGIKVFFNQMCNKGIWTKIRWSLRNKIVWNAEGETTKPTQTSGVRLNDVGLTFG